jgi:hypothetical protein
MSTKSKRTERPIRTAGKAGRMCLKKDVSPTPNHFAACSFVNIVVTSGRGYDSNAGQRK